MNFAAPRKLGIGRKIGLGFLAIIAVLLLWNVAWRISNNRAVARLEAAARQRGEPVTLVDLTTAYTRVPDEQNIHRALVEVWALEDPAYWNAVKNGIRPLPEMQSTSFPPDLPILGGNSRFNITDDLTPAERVAIRGFLSDRRARMDAVRAALRLKAYRANYDFAETYAMLMPEMAKLRREAQFFQLEALDAIAAKDSTRAIAAIAESVRVGHCLKDDPTLIGQLVRIACYNIAITTIERLLKDQTPPDAEVRRLEQILDEMKQDDGMKRALVTERVIAWTVLDGPASQLASLANSNPGDEAAPSGTTAMAFRMMRVVGMAGAEKRLMGETFDQVIRCLSEPDHAATDEMHLVFETMTSKARRFPPRMITMMLMPALERASERAARFEALRRCAMTALAIERQRSAHQGLMPAQLDAAGPFLLEDPFTGKPLLLKSMPGGYVVYSVGPDRKDDDARLDTLNSGVQNRPQDIGFRVEHK